MKNRPRVITQFNTGTRVMSDSRTHRRRTRSNEERHNLEEWFEDLADDDCDGTCRAGRYCIQHGRPA